MVGSGRADLGHKSIAQRGPIRGVRFHNVLCQGETGIFLFGGNESRVEDLTFSYVEIKLAKTSAIP